MMRQTRTLAGGVLCSLCFLSCTPTIQNELEPLSSSPEASTLAPEEPAQSGDTLGLCRRSPYDSKVKEMQPILMKLGYYRGVLDGCKGPKTVAAVERFQRDSALPVTGEIDEVTEAALREAKPRKVKIEGPPLVSDVRPKKPAPAPPVPEQKACSEKMRQMQGILREMGYYTGTIDGCPGPKVKSAVRQFQQSMNLLPTGEFDGATEAALLQWPMR